MSAMDKRVDLLTRRKFLPAAAPPRSSQLRHLPRQENCSLPSPIHPPNSADRLSSAFPLLRRSYFRSGQKKVHYAKVSFERGEWRWFRDGPIPLLSKEVAAPSIKRSRSLVAPTGWLVISNKIRSALQPV